MPADDIALTAKRPFNEIGFYAMAGAGTAPRDIIAECKDGEAMGIGAAFLSERFNVKEAFTSCGAMAAVTNRIGIGSAATNHNTRHPLVTAGHGSTMHRLTGGRFMLGLGRGIKPQMNAWGLKGITTAQMEEFAAMMRRLWLGEKISDYEGPLGKFPSLQLDAGLNEHIPLGVVAFAPQMLALGGRVCDAVILHTYFSEETTMRVCKAVRTAAEQAGRDPSHVRVWSVFATIGDHLPHPLRMKKTVGRFATYLQAYGDLLIETNQWDPVILKKFREAPIVANFAGAIDAKATTAELELIGELLPDEWLRHAATGSPVQCAAKVLQQFDYGVDSVIMHGASPAEIRPIFDAYAEIRPADRFDHLPSNPGGRHALH